MNPSDADRAAINKIIAEALGHTNFVCVAAGDDWWCTPPEDKPGQDLTRIVPLPDFCGSDEVALRALKVLRQIGFQINMTLYAEGESDELGEICSLRITFANQTKRAIEVLERGSGKNDSPIALALVDAMVEECPNCHNDGGCCTSCNNEGFILRPALEAAMKGDE